MPCTSDQRKEMMSMDVRPSLLVSFLPFLLFLHVLSFLSPFPSFTSRFSFLVLLLYSLILCFPPSCFSPFLVYFLPDCFFLPSSLPPLPVPPPFSPLQRITCSDWLTCCSRKQRLGGLTDSASFNTFCSAGNSYEQTSFLL